MRHDMIVPVRWMLMGMLVCIIGACSGNSSGGAAAADHPAVTAARLRIQPAYPDAAKIPVVIVADSVAVGWSYTHNTAVLSVAHINYTDEIELGCQFLVHEWVHKTQGKAYYHANRTRGELEALAAGTECLKIFGAPQGLIAYYVGLDGTHNAAAVPPYRMR